MTGRGPRSIPGSIGPAGGEPSAAPGRGRRPAWRPLGLGAALAAGLVALGLLGELGAFLTAGVNVAPFAGLAVLAALGERRDWARWLTYLSLALLNLGLLALSFSLVAAAALGPSLTDVDRLGPAALARLRPALLYLALGLPLAALTLLPLRPPVRRWFECRLPLRPGSLLNATGLSAVLALTALPLLALIVLDGRPPLLTLVRLPGGADVSLRPQDQVYGLVWLLPASLLMVGYPLRRTFGAALTRLGLTRPGPQQALIGVGAGIALLMLAQALDPAIARLWEALGWPRTDTQAFERLIAGLITPLGAVVIGVTAGLGEEVAVRGVLQPRVGLLPANLAFTAVHAYQYSFDGLLSVLLIGLALGLLRARTSTTTSAIAHGIYNFTLVLAAALGIGG